MALDKSSIDVISINTSEEIVGIILEISRKIPELEFFEASPVQKTYYKTMIRTALPSAGFRLVGTGMVRDVGTLTQRVVECGFLDASWSIDEAFFTGTDWSNLETEQQSASLLAALKVWQARLYNGADDIQTSGGFPGMASLFPYLDCPGVVGAAGTTATTGSSVYYVKTGTQDTCVAWGNNGEIAAGDVFPCVINRLVGGVLKEMNGRSQNVGGWAGLQIVNHKSIVRLANLTAEMGCTLTDDLLNTARTLFEQQYGVEPDGCLMSYRSRLQLQNSRQTFNPLGNQAPVPKTDSADVPIIPTLGITNTEALLANGYTADPTNAHPVQLEGAGGVQKDPS
jgi:hypothetical protein